MLSDEMISKQKKSLEEEKVRLEKKISELKKFPDYGSNEDDNARELTDYEGNLSLEEQLKILLKKVNQALRAIKDGNYGKCKKCSEEIESGRLEIMPYAELCVSCRESEK